MEHKSSLKFARVALRGADLTGWRVEGSGASMSVSGPCPACHGDASGPELPDPDAMTVLGVLPVDAGAPMRTVYIEAECHCGYEHGVSGGESCGRFWDVPILHADSSDD